MEHRASTGSLPPSIDPAHYGHPQPSNHYHNQYATNPSSPSDSAEDVGYYHGPPPGHGYPGHPPGHMGYPLPPHPLMRGGLPSQPAPMHATPPSLRGPQGEDFRRELGGGPREPPGPGGIGHRNTVSSGGPKPILRQPPAPPPPGDYPPSPEFRRPQGQRNPDAPQPGASTRDTSPDDFDYVERQYMHGRQPSRGGFPPDQRYSYADQVEARYRMDQAQQGRGRPGDQSPPYDYEESYGRGPEGARSRSRPRTRSRSVGPGARSRSRPPEREPQSAGPLVRAPQTDWFDDDYCDDYNDAYLAYPNGSDEVSGGSGPSRGAGNTHSRSVTRTPSVSPSVGHRSTRGEGVVAGGGPAQASRGPTNIRVNIGREAALDISYSGSSGAPHRVPKRDSTPAQQAPPAPPPPQRQVPTPAPQQQYAPPPAQSPAPPPQQQAPPPPPVAPVPPHAPPVVQQVVAAAPPPQQTTLHPSAGIVAVIPPAATEADHGVVYDADMDRETMMQNQLIPGMGGLTFTDPNPYANYFGMPVQLSDKFLYQGGEGRLRSKEERNLSDEEAGAPKLVKTTIGALRDREAEKERERDWDRRDRDKSRDRGDRGDTRRRRSVSRPAGERRRAGSAGPVEGKKPRWTRISREIISERAVMEMGYDFKPLPDAITIFKVLTRDEIDDLVDLSRKIREGRKPSGRGDRDRRDRGDRDDRDGERDRHRDDRRDRDDRDRDRDRDPQDRRERRHRDSWHGGKSHGVHQGHIAMPMAGAPHPPPAPAPAPPPPPPGSVHGGPPPPPPAPAPPQFHAPPMTGQPMTGPPMAGGLVVNPNEPGTFLKYRRNPPKPQGFYRTG
ncbi:hypothetical protein EV426DRAFT_702888 [Tirmania nivea]|nr:hypothetical protein EV426DRAFT_702888 [Tirmania nivea]